MTHTNVGKVILNIGAMTITEVTTATGKQGYRVQSRERKLLTKAQLPRIMYVLNKELRGKDMYRYYREWQQRNKPKDAERQRIRYQRDRDKINARRRELYALKKSMR